MTEPSARSRSASAADDVLAAAVELARAAAVETAGDPALVGDHLGAAPEPVAPETGEVAPEVLGAVLTHTFASRLPGYVGWHWAVTLARFPGEDAVTVDEVVLLPGEQALLAPAWVPWHERLRPGDLSVGDVLPSTEDDPRLVPSYAADDDSADDPEGSVVAFELGLGRERVMSREGRGEAVARWAAGEFGPRRRWPGTPRARASTCGFFLPLAGSLRSMLGRLRQRLRAGRRPRRHRRLRLRRAQPGDARAQRAGRGRDVGALRHLGLRRPDRLPALVAPCPSGCRRSVRAGGGGAAGPAGASPTGRARPARWPRRRSRSTCGRPGRRAAAGRRGRPPRPPSRPAPRGRCPPAAAVGPASSGPGTGPP